MQKHKKKSDKQGAKNLWGAHPRAPPSKERGLGSEGWSGAEENPDALPAAIKEEFEQCVKSYKRPLWGVGGGAEVQAAAKGFGVNNELGIGHMLKTLNNGNEDSNTVQPRGKQRNKNTQKKSRKRTGNHCSQSDKSEQPKKRTTHTNKKRHPKTGSTKRTGEGGRERRTGGKDWQGEEIRAPGIQGTTNGIKNREKGKRSRKQDRNRLVVARKKVSEEEPEGGNATHKGTCS